RPPSSPLFPYTTLFRSQMPAHLAGGVIAAVLARGVHARDPERLDLRGFRGLAVTREVQELALEIAGDAARELLAVELQRGGESRSEEHTSELQSPYDLV